MADERSKTPRFGTPRAGVPRAGTVPGTPSAREGLDVTPNQRQIIERVGTAANRDRDRDRHPPKHKSAPMAAVFPEEEITGRYEGEDLRRARARRPTEERFDRLERKADERDDRLSKIEIAVAALAGEFKVIPSLVDSLREELKARRQDDHVVLTTRLDVGKHEAITRIDTQALSVQSRWKLALRAGSWLFSAGGLGAIIALAASGKC